MFATAILLACCSTGIALTTQQETKPELPSRDELTIAILHDDQATCAGYSKSFRCSDDVHWILTLNGVRCADRECAEAFIKAEALRHPTPDPKAPSLSELKTKISAESGAPYAMAQDILAKCVTAGIYKVDVSEKKTGPEGGAISSSLGVGGGALGEGYELVVMIGKQLPQEKYPFRWVEAAHLKETIDAAVAGHGPRDELPVVLKPAVSTIWAEVLRVMKFCRDQGFERVEFAAPFKASDVQKK